MVVPLWADHVSPIRVIGKLGVDNAFHSVSNNLSLHAVPRSGHLGLVIMRLLVSTYVVSFFSGDGNNRVSTHRILHPSYFVISVFAARWK